MICGTVGWVTLATLTGLPVSTIHAIIGSMLVAGLLFAPSGIAWSSLAPRLAMPLLMDHHEGMLANIATALLVGVGANLGLPMSTTHVSTGAIAGIAGRQTGRLNARTVRELLTAWTITPLAAGIISVGTYLVVTRLI
ncbi:MAG: inorganic phosphate transporter [Pyrinomonadaceae bacterium]